MTHRRQIIRIDDEKCNGCGQCLTGCPEGALAVINGKVRLVRESYCDGLGACLGACPQGALMVQEADAEGYDEAALMAYLLSTAPGQLPRHLQDHSAQVAKQPSQAPEASALAAERGLASCPSARVLSFAPEMTSSGGLAPVQGTPCHQAGPSGLQLSAATGGLQGSPARQTPSALRQWPVQLRLLPLQAPFYEDAQLALIADCVPFAYPDLHANILAGEGVAIAVGCPKFDDPAEYVGKVAQILGANSIRSLKVYYMEVPCCRGLVWIAEQAIDRSGKNTPLVTEVINIRA